MALKTINKFLFLLQEKKLPCLELNKMAENQPVISHKGVLTLKQSGLENKEVIFGCEICTLVAALHVTVQAIPFQV